VTDAIHLDGILKRLHDRLLADHFFEDLGPELSGNDLIFQDGNLSTCFSDEWEMKHKRTKSHPSRGSI
jgi:hypothetical protein